jgi:hypothetical protein
MMKYIDITKIQAFPIPEELTVLLENNNVLKIANETLMKKNDNLQKLLIVSLIIIPLLGFVLYRKKQQTKKSNQ